MYTDYVYVCICKKWCWVYLNPVSYHSILFWGTWIVGDLGWQPSWLRILGEETPSRDRLSGDTELRWRSEEKCHSHLRKASPGNTSPTNVCRVCVRHMPRRWWIFRRNCGSVPFAAWGIQHVRLHPVRTVCADAKKAFVFPCCRTFAIWIPSFTARLSKNQTVASVGSIPKLSCNGPSGKEQVFAFASLTPLTLGVWGFPATIATSQARHGKPSCFPCFSVKAERLSGSTSI